MQKNQKGFGVIEILVVMAVIAIAVVGGWYVWQANQSKNQEQSQASSSTNSQASNSNSSENGNAAQTLFSIPELGVVFEKQDGITPVYGIVDGSYAGVSYKTIELTTQALIDKGASLGGVNPCAFTANGADVTGHQILAVREYASQADLLTVEGAHNSHLTAATLTPANGYITIGNNIFYVPQDVEAGQGACLESDSTYEDQQRDALRASLMTLKAE